MATIKGFLTVGAMIVLSSLVNAQNYGLILESGLCFDNTNSSNLWPAISCNVCETITSKLCFEDFHYTLYPFLFVSDLIQCGSFYVFPRIKFICVKNKTQIYSHHSFVAPRVCNDSAQLGTTEGFLRSCIQRRAYDSSTSNDDLYPSYTTPRYTKVSHTSSLYSRYSVMSDSTTSSYAIMSNTTPLHTTALNGAIFKKKPILNTGSTYKFTSNNGQPYTLDNPLDTVISKPVSTYQTKANISPTRSKSSTTTSLPTPENVKSKVEKEMAELNRKNISDKDRKEVAQKVIDKLVNFTNLNKMNKEGIKQQDLNDTVQILRNIVNLNIFDSNIHILAPANNILDGRNTKSWRNMKNDKIIRNLIITLENYGFQYGENLKNNSNTSVLQNYLNVELRVKRINSSEDCISTTAERLFTFPNVSFNLSSSALPLNFSAIVVVIWYKTIHSFLTNTFHDDEEIKSKIITASVRPKPTEKFSQPVRTTWNIKRLNGSARCVFWKPETNQKKWKSDGCDTGRYKFDSNRLMCECNHLTAFAVMDISRNMVNKAERHALELISTIGCCVSLLGICLTILTHVLLWKRLQHNAKTKVTSQVLIHLCGAIGMTDIFAILEGPAQNCKVFCTIVSILLYFFVLAVFGWMLREGILIYLQLVNVYTGLGLGGRHLKVFYVIGWGVPVVVVSILVGLNDRNDFITKHACWCRGGGVLFWTFVGTTGLILLINLVIFFLALRNALSSNRVNTAVTPSATKDGCTETKTATGATLKKAKVGLKGSAILLPLLGLTWIFGLLVFNRETIVFKYLFAISNSLQGIMIFLFHVLINRKVHEAISREKKARNARQMFNNTAIKNTCGGTLSTGERSSRKNCTPVAPTFSQKNFNGFESHIRIEDNDVITEDNKDGLKLISLDTD